MQPVLRTLLHPQRQVPKVVPKSTKKMDHEQPAPERESPPSSPRRVRPNLAGVSGAVGVSGTTRPECPSSPSPNLVWTFRRPVRTLPGVSGYLELSGHSDPDCPAQVMGLRALTGPLAHVPLYFAPNPSFMPKLPLNLWLAYK